MEDWSILTHCIFLKQSTPGEYLYSLLNIIELHDIWTRHLDTFTGPFLPFFNGAITGRNGLKTNNSAIHAVVAIAYCRQGKRTILLSLVRDTPALLMVQGSLGHSLRSPLVVNKNSIIVDNLFL